jgi:hypothetical protein
MTRTNLILIAIIFALLSIIGALVSYGTYVKGMVDGGMEVQHRLSRQNWINDYIQGGVPVCVSYGQVYEVEPKKAGSFKIRKSHALPLGGGPAQ